MPSNEHEGIEMKYFYQGYFKLREHIQKDRMVSFITSLAGLVAFVFAIKTSVLDANNIPSQSMEPTLMIGDFLFVNKMRYTLDLPYTNIHLVRLSYPKRGDIVTFTPPQDSETYLNKTLVKRVVGVPGDTIEINDHEITVSGTKYPTKPVENEALLKTLSDGLTSERDRLFLENIIDPVSKNLVVSHHIMKSRRASETLMSSPGRKWVIPPEKYLMMGDNRDHSSDGRTCEMVDSVHREACRKYNTCLLNTLSGHGNESECILIYSSAEGPTWGLIDANDIHGKVYLSYFSVNWGTGAHRELNPVLNLLKTITGEFKDVYVRWERAFKRIY